MKCYCVLLDYTLSCFYRMFAREIHYLLKLALPVGKNTYSANFIRVLCF